MRQLRSTPPVPCENCGIRHRGVGGKLSRCLQCLQGLVNRDRRLRAERGAFRSDTFLGAKLRGVEDGPVGVADVLVPGDRGVSKIDINRKR